MDKPTSDLNLYLRLLGYVKPYWHMFVISVFSMVILAATDPAIASLIKPLLDGGFIQNDRKTIVLVPILIVILFGIRGAADLANAVSMNWVSSRVVMDLRTDMFRRLLELPSHFYDHHMTGRLLSKFSYDVSQVKNASTNAITVAIKDSLSIIGLLAWMFYINWQLTAISLLCAPFIAVLVVVIRKRLRKMARKVQETMGDISHVISECVHNHKLIKIFGGQSQEADRFYRVNNNNRKFMMKFAIASAATGPGIQFISAIAIAVIVYIATQQAVAGILTVGEFISFITAMTMLITPLRRLVRINEFLQKAMVACESIFGLLDEPAEQDTGNTKVDRVNGVIEIDNISFRYNPDDTEALTGVSVKIVPGETVALVGASGSGKSTLANLLPVFYELKQGRIAIDGVDIRNYTLASLRANIALVSQDVVLFNDTVRNNIAYGSLRNCCETEIMQAAKSACALDFIQELPHGFDTVIGEKGQRLSGGQRQRLAVARALLKNAPILILDEATSSLDTESERAIQSALDTIRKDHTCIIIAHRLSTVENADRIIVIDQGRIVQAGRHAELIQQEGVYARLLQLQLHKVRT